MLNLKLLLVAALLVMSVLVDFTSMILSRVSDGILIGLAVYLAWPFINAALKVKVTKQP
jgi:hypothetical protein